MCGRFSRFTGPDIIEDYFAIDLNLADFTPKYNIAPSTQVPVIYKQNPIVARDMRWGIIPFYDTSGTKSSQVPVNARSETVLEKNVFKYSFEKRRCIIPADGFYEWKSVTGYPKKVPHFIHLVEDGKPVPMGLAGIYSTWYPEVLDEQERKNVDPVYSFAILTTEPNELMKEIHDRMPVILAPSDFQTWMDSTTGLQEAHDLCVPYKGGMEAYTVSMYVNSPNNDGEYCIKQVDNPLKDKDQGELDDYF